jgi:hypothetical protein
MVIPKYFNPLVQLLEDAADGASRFGLAIGLKQNTEPVIRSVHESLVGKPAGPDNNPPAVSGLMDLWSAAKSEKTAKTAALRSAISNGRALARTVVDALKPVLGRNWTSSWNAVGFLGGSLAVPNNPATLLMSMRGYLAANPAHEVKNINGIACTAEACQAAADAIIAADAASNKSNSDAGIAQKNLQDGINAAHNVLSGLQHELGQLLGEDDPRWLAFGFDLPGHSDSPDVPENLTVTPGSAGSRSVFAHCDDARRAEGYRFVVTNKANGAVVVTQLTQDPQMTFENLTSGITVAVAVSARNETGESAMSQPVTAVVP